MGRPNTQDWIHDLPHMQQAVLLTAIRGPDGTPKYAGVKLLVRWYRRAVLLSAMRGSAVLNPYIPDGGSFLGPSLEYKLSPAQVRRFFKDPDTWQSPPWEKGMDEVVSDYLRALDGLPHHFHMHLMHAAQIVGYKHTNVRIRGWWCMTYLRFCADMHVRPELEETMDERLGDSRDGWLKHADPATVK